MILDMKMMRNNSEKTLSLEKEMKRNDGNMNNMMSRRSSDKGLLDKKKTEKNKKTDDKQNAAKNSRFLITINVLGSAGPIRFVVNGDDNAAAVIETALKQYGREGRLPSLGSDTTCFFLYSANSGSDALQPSEAIGSLGVRNFVLCKKERKPNMSEGRSHVIDRKGSGWRAWLHKSFSLKILSH